MSQYTCSCGILVPAQNWRAVAENNFSSPKKQSGGYEAQLYGVSGRVPWVTDERVEGHFTYSKSVRTFLEQKEFHENLMDFS